MIDHILLDKSGYGEYPHPTPEPFRWSDKDMISLFFIFGWMLSIIIAFTGIEPWPTPEQDRWFYSWIMISILCLIGVIFGGSFIKDESSVKPKVKAYSSAEEEGIDIELEEEEVLLYYDEEEELR